MTTITTDHPHDDVKMLRETLCVAQAAMGQRHGDDPRTPGDIARIQRLIDDLDRQRPLGPDGKHGDRHTPTCGCEVDVPLSATIMTATQLDALPVGSVVLGDDGRPWIKDFRPFDVVRTAWFTVRSHTPYLARAAGLLPATVLHVPGQSAPAVKPGRGEIARVINPRLWSPTYTGSRDFADRRPWEEIVEEEREHERTKADAILALLSGRTAAEVKAEAWDEGYTVGNRHDGRRDANPYRADELERGEGR